MEKVDKLERKEPEETPKRKTRSNEKKTETKKTIRTPSTQKDREESDKEEEAFLFEVKNKGNKYNKWKTRIQRKLANAKGTPWFDEEFPSDNDEMFFQS